MRIAFLIDPLETFRICKDTSFALMLEAQVHGHSVSVFGKTDMLLKGDRLLLRTRDVFVTDAQGEDAYRPEAFRRYLSAPTWTDAGEFRVIFIRTDPPFDEGYLNNTWMLDYAPRSVSVWNAPAGIRTVNEKIWAARFTSITPATIITSDPEQYSDFISEHKTIIAKPTSGFGGSAVFLVDKDSPNAKVVFETLSENGRKPVIVQEYLIDALNGDKRILLLKGEPLGAVLRVHAKGDHRNNFAAGGSAVASEVTEADRRIIDILRPELLRLGLYFTGIDIIGGRLIEVNVTSPTVLREMQKLSGENLASRVIQAATTEVHQ